MDAAAPDLDAGLFGAWLDEIGAALHCRGEADVACRTCTGCGTASQFVLVESDEAGARAAVPAALLFPAPRRPGDHLLGLDERGRCPMLGDRVCTIYDHRPRTCRTDDCRVLAADDLDPEVDDPRRAAIAERARRWRFSHPGVTDQADHEAVRGVRRAR